MPKACEGSAMHTKFESKVLKERLYLGDLGADKRIILKWSVKKRGMRMCIGFVCLRSKTTGELL
jgi:hypothetical protein